ncbi:MAG: FAD-binding oxidoreductase, partial [Salinisphaeraceae bacterium]|nr:FAD-binding oxidoreductase [Salinisphaeraceae bacterium]
MTEVLFEGQCVPLESDQSALDGLLQAGFDIPHACQSGLCHSCVMQVDASQHAALGKLLNPEAQRGLSSAQLSRFEVLACQCRPKSRLALHLPGQLSVTRLATRVIHKRWLGEGVLGLTLERPQGYEYQAGQYLTLWHKEVGRCYSIASVPHLDQHLELHIRHYPDGALSTALLKYVAEGDTLHIQSPAGACYYQASKEQALLMLATGTGLA